MRLSNGNHVDSKINSRDEKCEGMVGITKTHLSATKIPTDFVTLVSSWYLLTTIPIQHKSTRESLNEARSLFTFSATDSHCNFLSSIL